MSDVARSQRPQPPRLRPLVETLYSAGLDTPRWQPELDLSPLAFFPEDYFLRLGLWPAGVDLFPPRAPRIVLPDHVDHTGERQLIVPEARS